MLGWWNGEVGGWYQGFRGCTCSFAEDEVAWWDNYSWVWTYQERQGDLFALSTYFDWSKVRDIPWNNLVPPDFCATRRAEIICWVSENKQPFKIGTNHGFRSLIKTGRPEFHIPSAETVSCDVQNTFICVWICITKMLQVSAITCIPHCKLTFNHFRNTKGHWALQPTHGHPQTTRHIWQLWSILKTRGYQWWCFLTLWNLHAHIPASIWQLHLWRSLRTSGCYLM